MEKTEVTYEKVDSSRHINPCNDRDVPGMNRQKEMTRAQRGVCAV